MRRRAEMSPADRAALLDAPTLTKLETARVLGIGVTLLSDALRRGDLDLPCIRVANRVLIPTAAVRRLLGMEDCRAPVTSPGGGIHPDHVSEVDF